ncbi:aminocarboxymuconate-semialdehyde decarboxylase [Rhodoferax sp. OV413]|uniref:amidohydrolase family protein n=1 Tax=Rhodoferax sp. OV413 TaxID=1855285 RepID=UPI0008813022|nr:amidohydrolase family protein [Rhodoferax sp. OV413]SDP61253.1 aminocarboxymuconate-semialdehyde decarboxylase [Rhodoferax sp. OV413]
MRIDVHAHFMSRDYYAALENLPGVTVDRRAQGMSFLIKDGAQWLPFRDAMFGTDKLLADMDRKGIDLRVLSLSTPSVYLFEPEPRVELCRRMNDDLVALVAQRPDRLRAFATLPLPDVQGSLEELERVRGMPGVVGITIGSNLDGMPLSDRSLEPLWARLNALRMPVFEHPMVPTFAAAMNEFTLPVRVGFLLDTSLAMCRMIYAGVFERHPDFPFIVAHTGASFLDLMERLDNGFRNYAECREHITRLPSEFARNFYYDTCSFFGPLITLAHGYIGREKLLFGTDYPFIDRGAEHVAELPISADDKDLILGGNARRLFGL